MLPLLLILVVVVLFSGGGAAIAASAGSYSYSDGGGGDVSEDQDTLARTIYGEARNQSEAGMQGVASVVMNRAGDTLHFPDGILSVAAICKQPYQFSCWNLHDPNLGVIEQVSEQDPIFQRCLVIAGEALSGSLPDNTGGAEYYYDTSISEPPFWSQDAIVRTVTIGDLVFGRRA